MLRHYGCFAHHATPATGFDSIEAPAEILSVRPIGAGFFERRGMGILELFCCVAWRFSDDREGVGNENSWRCGDGSFSSDRDALERACAIRVARGPQPNKRIGFSECPGHFDHQWLWPLLRRRRKTARLDELDSSGRRLGFASFVADPHPLGKEDSSYGSLLNEIAVCAWKH